MSEETEREEIEEVEEIHDQEEVPAGFISRERWEELGRDPEEWRDPQEFKEQGEKYAAVLKRQRDELKAEIDSFKQDFNQYRSQQEQFVQRKEREAYERAKREYDLQLEEISKMKREAIADMDGDKFAQAETMERQIRPPDVPQEPPKQQQIDPTISKWMEKNDWYHTDRERQEYAEFIVFKHTEDVRAGRMSVAQVLEKAEEEVKTKFSDRFGNVNRNSPQQVDSGGGERRPSKKSAKDLPRDAREAIERFVKRGYDRKTLEKEYIQTYFGD